MSRRRVIAALSVLAALAAGAWALRRVRPRPGADVGVVHRRAAVPQADDSIERAHVTRPPDPITPSAPPASVTVSTAAVITIRGPSGGGVVDVLPTEPAEMETPAGIASETVSLRARIAAVRANATSRGLPHELVVTTGRQLAMVEVARLMDRLAAGAPREWDAHLERYRTARFAARSADGGESGVAAMERIRDGIFPPAERERAAALEALLAVFDDP